MHRGKRLVLKGMRKCCFIVIRFGKIGIESLIRLRLLFCSLLLRADSHSGRLNNHCWVFTLQKHDTIMRDSIAEGCGNFNRPMFFNVHYYPTVHGPLALNLCQCATTMAGVEPMTFAPAAGHGNHSTVD